MMEVERLTIANLERVNPVKTSIWISHTLLEAQAPEAFSHFREIGSALFQILPPVSSPRYYRTYIQDVRVYPFPFNASGVDGVVTLAVEKGPYSIFFDRSGARYDFAHVSIPTDFRFATTDCSPRGYHTF